MQDTTNDTATITNTKFTWRDGIVRVIGLLFVLGGVFFAAIGIILLLFTVSATRVKGVVVVDSCQYSLGRGATTTYECKGNFIPDDSSIPPKYFESNAGGGILVGTKLEPGVHYNAYVVAGFDDTPIANGSQVVVEGDSQSQQSGYMSAAIFTVIGLVLIFPGIMMWRTTTKKARAKRSAQQAAWQKNHHVANADIPKNVSKMLDDPNQKLTVRATKISGPLDSAVHGGGVLTLQNGIVHYSPKSQKVTPIDVAVADIVKLNVHKTRFEIYTSAGAHYSFVVTVPYGTTYAYIDANDPMDLILTAISLGDVIADSVGSAGTYRNARGAWEPWVAYIIGRKPDIVVEHKSRTLRVLLLAISLCLIPLAIIAAIAMAM